MRMLFPLQDLLLFFFLAFQLFTSVICDRNVTLDDNDPSIQYTPANVWNQSFPSISQDFGGFHMFTDTATHPHAKATLNFTGTAAYVMAPKWPYMVGAQVSLDGSSPEPISMKDPARTSTDETETVGSSVLWSKTGLSNDQHTLEFSVLPGTQFVVVDGIIYTVPDDNSTSTSSGDGSSSSSHSSSIIPVVVGVVGGVVVLALIVIIFLLVRRRRRRTTSQSAVDIIGDSPYQPPEMRPYDHARLEAAQSLYSSAPSNAPLSAPPSSYGSGSQYGSGSGKSNMSYVVHNPSQDALGSAGLYSAGSSSSAGPSAASSSAGLLPGGYAEKKFESAAAEKSKLKEAYETQQEAPQEAPPPRYEA